MNKNIQRGLVLVGALVGATGAMAAGPDMSALTSALHFGTVVAAVLSIAGMLAIVYVSLHGARIFLSMIKSNGRHGDWKNDLPGYPEELLEREWYGDRN